MTPTGGLVVERGDHRLGADPSRVLAQLFVPGQEIVEGRESRASGIVGRILALDDAEVRRELDELVRRFGDRHRDLPGTFRHHADLIGSRLDLPAELSEERWLLLGATFTHEYSVEAASLCNPSIVEHPDQSGASEGSLRFIMSVRGIGEGHRSSIGFRTGTVGPGGDVRVDEPGPFPTLARVDSALFDDLADSFSADEIESQLGAVAGHEDTRSTAHTRSALLRSIAACSYSATFPVDTLVSERVLVPAMGAESSGMEDARFVRFVDDDGSITYYASYTAFDGVSISQQLLSTTDFVRFTASPMIGPAARDKGLALFPRRIGGRFVALSRHDRETNAIASSTTLSHWADAVTCQTPDRPWEAIQLGNCGSPIETDAGWLVLTHGVGPMRTYSIGAMVLDLDDPTKLVRTLAEPLLFPSSEEQDGYVPNVVYSCGALVHGETLVIPHGIADTSIGIATVHWPELLDAMVDP